MSRTGVVCVAVLLAGCLSQPRTPEPALYDLGIAPVGAVVPAGTNAELAAVRVRTSARSWLDDTAMHYRLMYLDGMRTLTYAYARWIAPPAELVGQRLRQRLAESGIAASVGSTPAPELDIELEEFVQVFETPPAGWRRQGAPARPPPAQRAAARSNGRETPDAVGGVRALAAATAPPTPPAGAWPGAARGEAGGPESGGRPGGRRPNERTPAFGARARWGAFRGPRRGGSSDSSSYAANSPKPNALLERVVDGAVLGHAAEALGQFVFLRCGCVIRARLLARSETTLPRRRRPRWLARRAHRPVRDVRR